MNAKLLVLSSLLWLAGGAAPGLAGEAAGPASTPVPSSHQSISVDPRLRAVSGGALGGAILLNLASCGVLASAAVGALVADYWYRRSLAGDSTPLVDTGAAR